MTTKRRKGRAGRRVVLCAGLLLLARAAAAAADVPLTGAVADSAGRPLAGADVALFEPLPPWRELAALLSGEPPAPAGSTRTDGDGRFVLAAPAGVWRLEIAAPGHAPRSLVVPLATGAGEQGTVRLAADAGLEVTVLDPEGRPVQGAQVAALIVDLAGLLEGAPLPPRRALTDVAGRARLPRPQGLPGALAVAAPGFAPATVELGGGDGTAVVRLAAGEPWAIEVRDPQRRPLAGAVVATEMPHLPLAITGDDGVAHLRLPERDPMLLAVVAAAGTARLLAEPERVPAGESEPRRAFGTLSPWHTLAGRVLGAGDGRPLAGAVVWHLFEPGLLAMTGPDGGFSLPLDDSGAHDGTWLIGAAAPGHRTEGESVERSGEGFETSLQPLAGVAGRVVGEDGEPVAGASLVAATGLLGIGAERAWSDARGDFALHRLDADSTQAVRITHPDLAPAEIEVKTPAAGAVASGLRITLARGGRLHATVHAADGRPLAGAEARLDPAGRQRGDDVEPPAARTGADGRFAIERVPPGRYDLRVAAPGHAPLRLADVEVPKPPAERDLGRLELRPGAPIAGRVVDADGRPVAGATVSRAVDLTTMLGGTDDFEEVATTGADGRFVLADLEPGSTRDLTVEAPGFVPASLRAVRAPPERPLHVVLSPAAAVAGEVVDGDGEGIAGAMVTINNGEAGNLGFTGADGSFFVAGLPAGEVRMQVHARGTSPVEPMVLDLEPGERREGVRIELERRGALAGRVTGPDGAPLAGAIVRALPPGPWLGLLGKTDEDGRYRIDGVPPGALQVRVEHPGHLPAVREVEAVRSEVRLDVEMEEGHRVSGLVVDAAGSPVAEAQVELRHPVRRGPAPAETGLDGRFELAGVAPGEWRLLASRRGHLRAERPLAVEGPVEGVELRLGEGAAIVGQVRGLDSADLARLHVYAKSPGAGSPGAEVDPTGGYRIAGLRPGPWHVTAELGQDEGTAGGTITLVADEEARLDLDFDGDLVLGGRVTLAGSPIGGAYVIWSALDEAISGRQVTDADGRFRLARLPPGRYLLQIDASHPEVVHRLEIDLDGDREVAIEVAAGEIAGRAVDAESGEPIGGVEIRLWGDGARYGTGTRVAVTGSDGAFRAARVAAGRYRLVAERQGYAVAHLDVEVAPGAARDGIEVALRRSAGGVLLVSSAYGPPRKVSFAAVPAESPPPSPERPAMAVAHASWVTSDSGRVELPTLPAGRWRVHLEAIGFAAAAVDLVVPGPPVPVALTPHAVLDVRVPALFGSGVPARVRLLAAGGRPLVLPGSGGAVEAAWPLDFGQRHLENVPPGTWTVEVTADDGRRWAREVTAAEGVATEVVLEP